MQASTSEVRMSKAKTETLPAVRIEPELREQLERIARDTQPEASVSAHVRQAVVEYVDRKAQGKS